MQEEEHTPQEGQSLGVRRDHDPLAAEKRRLLASRRRQLRCHRLKGRKLQSNQQPSSSRKSIVQDSFPESRLQPGANSVELQMSQLRQEQKSDLQNRLAPCSCTRLMASIEDHMIQYQADRAGLFSSDAQQALPSADDLLADDSSTRSGSMLAHSGLDEVLPESEPSSHPSARQNRVKWLLNHLNMLRMENIHLKHRLASCTCLAGTVDDQMQHHQSDWGGLPGSQAQASSLLTLPYNLSAEDPNARRSSVQSTASRFDIPMEQHQRDDVDLALWLAANRPARPDGWASVEGQEAKEPVLAPGRPHALHTGGHLEQRISRQQHKHQAAERQTWSANAQPVEEGHVEGGYLEQHINGQQQNVQAVERHGWGASGQPVGDGHVGDSQGALADAVRPGPTQHDAVIDLDDDAWAGSLDVLPDVPGGLESVDQLATHISLWPTTSAAESSPAFARRIPLPSFPHH